MEKPQLGRNVRLVITDLVFSLSLRYYFKTQH